MKYLVLSFLIVCAFSCNKVDKLTQFNMDYTTQVTIPSNTVVSLPIDLFTPDIQSNSESTFSSNNTNKDLIEEVKLTSMNLVLKSPTNGDFSFLDEVRVFIDADGLNETEIATALNISAAVDDELELDTDDVNLMEFLKKDKFSLRVYTVTDEAIVQDHEIEVNSTFFVDARILGN